MESPFMVVLAKPCGKHDDVPMGARSVLSCSCGHAGFYVIIWNGPGLGIICDTKHDAERQAHLMNTAWNLAKGMSIDEIVALELNRGNW